MIFTLCLQMSAKHKDLSKENFRFQRLCSLLCQKNKKDQIKKNQNMNLHKLWDRKTRKRMSILSLMSLKDKLFKN